MRLYKRGRIFWYEFEFGGQRIRESSKSANQDIARRNMSEHKRKLELGTAGLKERKKPLLFSVAARQWLELNRAHWSNSNQRIEGYNVDHLLPHFAKLLLTDITGEDVSRYQAARKKEHASPRTINMEVGTLRAILRKHRLWANIQPDVRMLKTRQDIGRALTADEQHRLLIVCKNSRSRSLYPAVVLSLLTGLRNGELRLLQWRQVDLLQNILTVGKSKTEGGEGRQIPLSPTALQVLQEWRSQFPCAFPSHYVFPSERYGLNGEDGHKGGATTRYEVRPDVPIGSWKVSWTAARKAAGVQCRWHDFRHCFVNALSEGKASDTTIMSLAGHLSRKMMELYSHTRLEAKRSAISAIDSVIAGQRSTQFPPQSEEAETFIRQ